MISAFGVDHGYETIEKIGLGGGLTRLGQKLGSGAQKAGLGVQNRGASLAQKAKKPGTGLLGQRATGALGEGHLQAGGRLHGLGQKMLERPKLTGGLAAGGAGAAGLGGAGSLLNRRRQ